MLDLSPHRQREQDQPVHDQHRPEHWQVENLEPAAHEADGDRSRGRMPELELGQPSDKRPELVVLFRGQGRAFPVLQTFILRQARVELGLQEGQEQIQQVDAEAVGDNVPSLREDDAEEEQDDQGTGRSPSVGNVRRAFVEVSLVEPQQSIALRADRVKWRRIRLRSVHGGGSSTCW